MAKKTKKKVASTRSKIETTRRYKDGTSIEITKPISNKKARQSAGVKKTKSRTKKRK